MQNIIFLYDPKHRDVDAKLKLEQIVNLYKYDMEDIQYNIDRIIEYLAKHIGDGPGNIYIIAQHIRLRLSKNGQVVDLPIIEFLCNMIMMTPLIDMGIEIEQRHIFNPIKLTDSEIRRYINNMIYEYRDRVTFFRMCEYIQFVKKNFNKICTYIGVRIGNSISLNQFISVMDDNEEMEEIMTCSFNIPKDLSPSELEDLVNKKSAKLMNYIMTRQDLDISTYVKNNLFNKAQFKEFAVHITHKPSLTGNTVPLTSNTNILMGIKDTAAYFVDAKGGKKAEVLKLKVSDAGDFERTLCSLLSDIRYVDIDYEMCDSKYYRKKEIKVHDDIESIDGRIYTLDPESNKFHVVDARKDNNLIGHEIYMKTPITCTHPKRDKGYICKACYGHLLAMMNADIHIGRMSALSASDEMQQILLSAKHALETKSEEIIFSENFDDYFRFESAKIYLLDEFKESLSEDASSINLFLEFNSNSVRKRKDGEGRRFDRSITEIIIYNADTSERIVIEEKGRSEIFMSPELSELYTEYERTSIDDTILIPLTELVEFDPEIEIFEVTYKNSELAEPLERLTTILDKTNEIEKFKTYDEFLDVIIPLFIKGGIRIPEIHIEMIATNLIYTPSGRKVDWSHDDVDYKFFTMTKAILLNNSPLVSLMYKNMSEQMRGLHYTYEKDGTSIYDVYIDEGEVNNK